jgi:Ca2+-binding RTX toxin-like protein
MTGTNDNDFDNPGAANLIGLWEFNSGAPGADTGLADGIAQNGNFQGNAFALNGALKTDGHGDKFEVDFGAESEDDPFAIDSATVVVEFTQTAHKGSSPDYLVSRGEEDDADEPGEGHFGIFVTKDGHVVVVHETPDGELEISTEDDPAIAGRFFNPGDDVRATYSFDETGGTFTVENITTGAVSTQSVAETGLTFDIIDGPNEESFTFGAREEDDGEYDKFFFGQINYVAVFDGVVGAGDGIVEGSSGDDLIDTAYTGDPENDVVDGGDALLPGAAPDDDLILAFEGNDTVEAGEGDDTVYGGSGDDSISGGTGNDTLFGDTGGGAVGGAGAPVREVFEWDEAPDPNGPNPIESGDPISGPFTQDTGSNNVTFSIVSSAGITTFSSEDILVDDIVTDGGVADDDSSLDSLLNANGSSVAYRLDFESQAENLSFRVNDIDFGSQVTILAYDAEGNLVPVGLTVGEDLVLGSTAQPNDTATSNGGGGVPNEDDYSVLVEIAGPIERLEIVHNQVNENQSGINISDIYFDTLPGDLGPEGADTIDGGEGDDEIFGEGGDDVLAGGDGDDSVEGGEGDDAITAGAGDSVSGGDDADTIVVDQALLDGAGNKTGTISADGGSGGDDDDTLDLTGFDGFRNLVSSPDPDGNSTSGSVEVLNSDGDWVLVNFAEIETLLLPSQPPDGVVDGEDFGETMGPGYDDADGPTDGGGDVIDGPDGNDDTILGNGGDDTIDAGLGDDSVDGGEGNDSVFGGEGDDTLVGGSGVNTLDGGAGDDTLVAGDEGDTLIGGAGNDDATGGDGDDVIDTSGPVTTSPTGPGGRPDLGYPGLFQGDEDPFDDRDTVVAGAGDDTITTGDDDDFIDAGAGDDSVDAGFDKDTVLGGDGDDTIIGGEGNDSIDGGDGDDLIYGGLGPGSDPLDIEDDGSNPLGPDLQPDNGRDILNGGAGDDTIFGQDDDDTISGGDGDDYLDGGIDDDTISGDAGEDTIFGGQGNDSVDGGTGDDLIEGGSGADTLGGGDDRDTFVASAPGDMVGDEIDGGGGGDDFDTLDVTGAITPGGRASVQFTSPDEEDGIIRFFDDEDNLEGTATFQEIESVIGATVVCFTRGTLIATPQGERPVEELREGDRVLTRDNGMQEIRWMGSKHLDWRALKNAQHLRPVLIRAGALGGGLPERDMMVSPNHRMLVTSEKTALYFEDSEVLVAAKHLVGIDGIAQVDTMGTTYVHFMCDRHEVVLANGAWSESFQPGDYSLRGLGNSQRSEIFELFPELANSVGVGAYRAARKTLKRHEASLLI